MIDPVSIGAAFAVVKSGLAAGKQLHSMAKEVGSFFDAVDGAKETHQKKKKSIFASANEEAMDTFMRQQQAIDCEAELRELITQTRGYSQYQALLNLRRQIRVDRQAAARLAQAAYEERQQAILSGVLILAVFAMMLGSGVGYMWYLGWVKF
jgi:erythromycin esterase-like protein|tara:strand:- start:43 stop:498 length:456 start_codon:yes stop_codon:yes gene_type:complete